MSVTTHERPGVYSEYDASSVVQGRQGRKMVGMAAIHATAPAGVPQTVTSYEGALIAFGSTGGQDMTELIRLALKNGAAGVVAVPVADDEGYEAAFAALAAMDDIGVVICDSVDREVQQSLRDSAAAASAARRERIAVAAGGAGETVTELLERAKALNSERVVLVAPGGTDEEGKAVSGLSLAAAVAGAIAGTTDPALPLGGAVLSGLYGLETTYGDNDLDLLIRGGVTPAELGGAGSDHTNHYRRDGGHHLERAVHHPGGGRRDPRHPLRPAQQVPPGQEHGAEPGGHPLPGGAGAGEPKGAGDHLRL